MDAHIRVRPYSQLAATYDRTLGIPNFIRTRNAFEKLVTRYGIEFRSAADIGCGTGLFACYLSRCWGVTVFAVDRSPEMLREAMRKCPGSKIFFLKQDVRQLRLPCRVDLVTANFDTLNHLLCPVDLKVAFRRVYESLRPGGHFIFDLLTHRQLLRRALTHVWRLRGSCDELLQNIRWNPRRRLLSILIIRRQPSLWQTIEVHKERLYSPLEAGRGLLESGFTLRGVHDAITLRPAIPCPPRIILVAKKELLTG